MTHGSGTQPYEGLHLPDSQRNVEGELQNAWNRQAMLEGLQQNLTLHRVFGGWKRLSLTSKYDFSHSFHPLTPCVAAFELFPSVGIFPVSRLEEKFRESSTFWCFHGFKVLPSPADFSGERADQMKKARKHSPTNTAAFYLIRQIHPSRMPGDSRGGTTDIDSEIAFL